MFFVRRLYSGGEAQPGCTGETLMLALEARVVLLGEVAKYTFGSSELGETTAEYDSHNVTLKYRRVDFC